MAVPHWLQHPGSIPEEGTPSHPECLLSSASGYRRLYPCDWTVKFIIRMKPGYEGVDIYLQAVNTPLLSAYKQEDRLTLVLLQQGRGGGGGGAEKIDFFQKSPYHTN
jgi:hypothetical protein